MDTKLYPAGNQYIAARDIETAPTQTDLVEVYDAEKTTDRKAIAIRDLLSSVVRHVRTRYTIAAVNAGAALLPAVEGYRYRLVSAAAIGIGGAVGAVTTVDVLGTQGGNSVKLIAFGQSALTQNTVVKDGTSGGAVLAGGASYASNDAGAGLTVGKTGDAITTATHLDVLIAYVLERG